MLKKYLFKFYLQYLLNFLSYLELAPNQLKIQFKMIHQINLLIFITIQKMASILEKWGERNAWIEIQHLLYDKKGKILDVACGTGKVIEILNKISIKDVYGCDISDYLIQKAVERGIPIEKLKVCDATELQTYEDDYFNYSYSIGSLEHFTEDQIIKFLISTKKVTKYCSFHQIPTSRSNKNEGWISPLQSYYNIFYRMVGGEM